MRFIIALIMLLSLIGCSSVQPPFEPESFKKGLYRKDMKIDANGYKGHGVVVVPKQSNYKMEVLAMGNLDLFTFTSCHREITQEDAGYKGRWLGIGKNKKLAKMEFMPAKNIEDNGSCPIDFGGYEKSRGRHSWGVMLMENTESTLPSLVQCNGRDTQYRGTSACQSRAGLVQRIEFPRRVVYDLDSNCNYENVKLIDDKIFEYQMPEGQCTIYFQEVGGEKRISEHYDYGYSKIIISGD